MKKNVLVLVILILYACSGSKNTADNWVGKSKNSLINTWGPPVRIIQDSENGNEILLYANQIYEDQNTTKPRMAGAAYWDYVYVYLNKEGKIYSLKNEKKQLRPQEIAVK